MKYFIVISYDMVIYIQQKIKDTYSPKFQFNIPYFAWQAIMYDVMLLHDMMEAGHTFASKCD